MIPTIVLDFLGAAVRMLLAVVGGYLIRKGVIGTDAWSEFMTKGADGLAFIAAAAVWMAYRVIQNRRKLVVAKNSTQPLTDEDLKRRMKWDKPPLLALAIFCVLAAGCATKERFFQVASQANLQVAQTTANLQVAVDLEYARDCMPDVEGLQRCVSEQAYQDWKERFSQIADIGVAISQSIAALNQTTAVAQFDAALSLLQAWLRSAVPGLTTSARLVVTTTISVIRTTLAAYLPPPAVTP